jgi:hypothetical protein
LKDILNQENIMVLVLNIYQMAKREEKWNMKKDKL